MNSITKFINNNMALLFQFFLFSWILFIPMKTVFYQMSYMMMLTLVIFHIYINKTFDDLLYIFVRLKDIIFVLLCILLSMAISNAMSEFSTFMSWKVEFTYIYRYIFASILLLYAYQQHFFPKKTLVIFIIFSLFVQSAEGIHQYLSNLDSLNTGLNAWTHNRNTLGMFMAIGSSIVIGIIFYNQQYQIKNIERFLLIVALFLFLFNLLFSYSRASWLAFFAFIVVLWLSNLKTISRKKYFFILCFLAIFISLFLTIPHLAHRFNSMVELDSSYRFEIWKHAWALIIQKPFFGYGLMSYSHIGMKNITGVHNALLEILLYLGLLGFIFYSTIFFKVIKEQVVQKNFFFLSISLIFIVLMQFDQSITGGIVFLSPLSIFAFFIFEKRISNE